jgi:hypothetical protein
MQRNRQADAILDYLFEAGFVAIMLLLIVSFSPLVALDTSDNSTCGIAGSFTLPTPIILASFACFVIGSVLRTWRVMRIARMPRAELGEVRHAPDRPDVIGVATLPMLFFLLVVILLAYETWAVIDVINRWPITRFIRCADTVAPGRTALGACLIAFLFGHWFWNSGPVWRFAERSYSRFARRAAP